MPEGLPDGFGLLAKGMELTKRNQGLVIRVLWVVTVSTLLLWICGFVSFFANPPYAKAGDVQQVQRDVAQLQHTANVTAKINLTRELRDQYSARCELRLSKDAAKNASAIEAISHYIDTLLTEYLDLTGKQYPEPVCTLKGS